MSQCVPRQTHVVTGDVFYQMQENLSHGVNTCGHFGAHFRKDLFKGREVPVCAVVCAEKSPLCLHRKSHSRDSRT